MNNPQFKIEQKLNESATTVVYRAFDQVLHRTVLLKVLHKHLANDHDLKQRFVREARACAALHSEHIVQIYDLTEIDGAPAIVMEFVEGKSLKELIASGSTGSFEFTKKVGAHILHALVVAHERGIIHRDIKPGNILVSENGTVKVTDFGLAYVALSPTVTMEGMVLGTPAYMAPEQVRGDDIDQRTDLFALGVTLVETLTGERIFEGSTYTECMKKVLAFKIQELDRFDKRSTPEFTTFLRMLLHPSKSDRYVSSRDALAGIGEQIPIDKKVTNGNPLPKNRNNRIIPIGMTVIVALAVVFGLVEFAQQGEGQKIVEQIQSTDSTNDNQQSMIRQPIDPSVEFVPVPMVKQNPVKLALPITKDSGRLLLTSTPWAKVYVDNRLIGETPIAKPVILAAGDHMVMFTNPSFDPIVTTITVEPGRELTAIGNFVENAGYLMCVISPWAEVYVDEQYKDTTPLTKPLILSSGKHTVRFKNAAFSDITREINVKPKDTVTVTISFTQ
ncbi:MAG: serine/threonine-protein kinase [Bacteriovoracaceae bacterium]